MVVMIVDGQGGGVGRALTAGLKKLLPYTQIIAVGTNSIAASAMKKAGADVAATGENAVKVNARKADIIAGPLGIIAADALYGEITAEMANAISASDAWKVLVPFSNCQISVAGCGGKSSAELIAEALQIIADKVKNG